MVQQNELPDIFRNTVSTKKTNDLEDAAAAVIASMSEQYPIWTLKELEKADRLYQQILSLNNTEQNNLIRGDFYRIIHDIKGQGSTFGYPLMTTAGAYLCTLIKTHSVFSSNDLNKIADILQFMHSVLEQKLSGDHKKGTTLLEHITKECS